MKILVTGGAGFIGSHLVDAYLQAGHDVLAVDDLSSGQRSNLEGALRRSAKLEVVSILDRNFEKLVGNFQPDLINHHAAQKSVRESVLHPDKDCEINLIGLLRVLEAAKKTKCRRIVFASSGGAIYGEQETFPADESHGTRPLSPYGITKLCGEHYLRFYSLEFGFEVLCLRYANVYGPRQDPEGEAGVIAIFCDRVLKSEGITIFGSGEQTRDFVYVEDVVAANLAWDFKTSYEEINVGTGVETSVNRLASSLFSVSKDKAEITHATPRPGEQMRSVLDFKKARQVLGWTPKMSLEEGLSRTLQWFREKKKLVA